MTKIVNLTPHEIDFMLEDGTEIKIPPSGRVARLEEETKVIGEIDGIPVVQKQLKILQGLPEPQPDTIYIVSLVVAQKVKEMNQYHTAKHEFSKIRDDIYIIGESIRDEAGRIVGAKSLAKL